MFTILDFFEARKFQKGVMFTLSVKNLLLVTSINTVIGLLKLGELAFLPYIFLTIKLFRPR